MKSDWKRCGEENPAFLKENKPFGAFQMRLAKAEAENVKLREEAQLSTESYAANSKGWQEDIDKLRSELEYKNLYISYLLGQITKEDFKAQAVKFAEPLNLDKELKEAIAHS